MLKERRWWVALVVLIVSAVGERVDAQPYIHALASARYPNITGQRLLALDTATNTFVDGIQLGRTQGIRPNDLAIAPDGSRIYAINSLDFSISVVSTQPYAVVATWTSALVPNPSGVAVSADSRSVFVTGSESVNGNFQAALYVIDALTGSRTAKIPLGFRFAYGVAVSPAGGRAYVVTGASGTDVAVVDTVNATVITTVLLPGERLDRSVAISPDGRYVYLTRYNGNAVPGSVQVLDTSSNTIAATTTVGVGARHVAVSPDGATVYVTGSISPNAGEVHRVNAVTHGSDGVFAVPGAYNAVFRPDSRRAYVAGSGFSIFVVDTASHAVLGAIAVPVNTAGSATYGGVGTMVAAPSAPSPIGAPSAPVDLRATVSGSIVSLAWMPAPAGGAASSFELIGRLVAGGPVLATVPMGGGTSFSIAAPNGTFVLTVRAVNTVGAGPESAPVTVSVPQGSGSAPPAAPTLNAPTVSGGSTVSLSWSAGAGGAPTSYTLTASMTPGGAPIVTVPLTGTAAVFPGVPSGTYYLRLTASNAAGTSSASPLVTLTVP